MSKPIQPIQSSICDNENDKSFYNSSKTTVKHIKKFNSEFLEILEELKKKSRDLWQEVIRYNALNIDGICNDSTINLENIMRYFLTNIQDKTTSIRHSIESIKIQFNEIPKLEFTMNEESMKMNWNPTENPAIRGTIHNRSPSELLEDVAEIIYNFDIAITCIFHYFNVLELKNSKSYENLMNSFKISQEFSDKVDAFLIKNFTMLN